MALPPLEHIESQDPRYFAFSRQRVIDWLRWAGASLGVWLLLGELGLLLSLLALGAMLLWNQLQLYHKVQLENFHHYRQMAALLSLHQLITIRYPLPAMRLWVISPDFATLIVGVIQCYKPKIIVELGSGTSTIICGYVLESLGGGRVISYEHKYVFASDAERELERHGLSDYANIIIASLTETNINGESYNWYDALNMKNIGPIDLLIIDGPPQDGKTLTRYPALPVLYDQLAAGAIILVDDYMRSTEHQMVNCWIEEHQLDVIETITNEKGAVVLRKPA